MDAVFNEEAPSELFEISFPPGTVVYDERTDTRYIQLADGQRRVVTPEEQRARISYATALRTASGEGIVQHFPTPATNRAWILVLINVGVAIVILAIMWRRSARPDEMGDVTTSE